MQHVSPFLCSLLAWKMADQAVQHFYRPENANAFKSLSTRDRLVRLTGHTNLFSTLQQLQFNYVSCKLVFTKLKIISCHIRKILVWWCKSTWLTEVARLVWTVPNSQVIKQHKNNMFLDCFLTWLFGPKISARITTNANIYSQWRREELGRSCVCAFVHISYLP